MFKTLFPTYDCLGLYSMKCFCGPPGKITEGDSQKRSAVSLEPAGWQ